MTEEPRYVDLAGRRVLVTGAGAGIGRAVALAFARQGCRLVLNDLDAHGLETVRDEVEVACALAPGSVADPGAVEGMMQAAETAFGGVDILVANAGISANKPTLELSHAEWRRAMEVNLDGVFLTAQAAARRMIAQGSGVILTLASMYGVVAAPERLAYCVSKAGVAMMTKALAIEWARHGLRVNAIAPGYIETALVQDLAAKGRLDVGALARRTPLGRLGQPEEIADLAIFLASDRCRWMTGQVVGLDGGWTAYGYV
jgi:NAD(P)-dependent dehydrogenase (short-subunit alcohol dehydrogenase family)